MLAITSPQMVAMFMMYAIEPTVQELFCIGGDVASKNGFCTSIRASKLLLSHGRRRKTSLDCKLLIFPEQKPTSLMRFQWI